MLRTSARRGVVGGTALLVGLAGLTIGQGAADAAPPLPVTSAGPVAIWGPGDTDDCDPAAPPAPTSAQADEAFTKVVANGYCSAIGLTADGTIETLGTNLLGALETMPTIPAGQKVVDIAGDTAYGSGMAVTDTGNVYTWATPYDVWHQALPDAGQLQGSKAVAISSDDALAAVVKQDGSVLVWGTPPSGDRGQLTPPQGLTGVTSVFFNESVAVYALKSDGTLAAWGDDGRGQTDLPPVTTDASDDVNVTDVASAGQSAVALLSDGSLAAWGQATVAGGATDTTAVNEPPADIEGKDIVALAANGNVYFAVDSDGDVFEWGQGASQTAPEFAHLPDGVDPALITGLSANPYFATAIQAKFSYLAKPTVAGTAKVGQMLTATPATFTSTPDSTTGQWLANGAAITGATGTTLKLTTAQQGKTITYSETAHLGNLTAVAISDPTAKVAALSTGGGGSTTTPGGGHVTPPVVQNPKLVHDQAKLKKDQTKLKKLKKKAKKAHGAKKAKLQKQIKKLKKTIKKDKKHIKADK